MSTGDMINTVHLSCDGLCSRCLFMIIWHTTLKCSVVIGHTTLKCSVVIGHTTLKCSVVIGHTGSAFGSKYVTFFSK